jgi:hypothetical protein
VILQDSQKEKRNVRGRNEQHMNCQRNSDIQDKVKASNSVHEISTEMEDHTDDRLEEDTWLKGA